MYWVFRITRLAPGLFAVDFDYEPPCGVSVKSIPVSGGRRFATRRKALAWIRDFALANGIDERKLFIDWPQGWALRS